MSHPEIIQPYWILKREACRAEKPTPRPGIGFLCTREDEHAGKHVAHDMDGSLITSWGGGRPLYEFTDDLPWGRFLHRHCRARLAPGADHRFWGRCELAPHSTDIDHALERGMVIVRWSAESRLEHTDFATALIVRKMLEEGDQ